MKKEFYLLFLFSVLIFSCEQDVEVDLNNNQSSIVVEGYIEPYLPSYVFLSKSQPFFDEINETELNNLFITDAKVTVTRDDGRKRLLTHVSQEIVDSLAPHFNIDSVTLPFYSIYIDLNPFFEDFNEVNYTFNLNIELNNITINADTYIPPPFDIDSVWCECSNETSKEYECYIHTIIHDPDTVGNILYAQYKRYDGESIDKNFRICSRFLRTDFLWNGTDYSAFFSRSGTLINEEGNGGLLPFFAERIENGSLLTKDKVIFKISQISNKTYLFLRSKKLQEELNNNPFGEPSNLLSSIEGGLGVWAGFGSLYYKVDIDRNTIIYENYKPSIIDIFNAYY